jgi:uncharacterized RmlC-like cupin family protein
MGIFRVAGGGARPAALPRQLRERALHALGAIEIRWATSSRQSVVVEAGDMLYVPPRETHTVQNVSDSEPAEYVVARDRRTEDSVEVPWADQP